MTHLRTVVLAFTLACGGADAPSARVGAATASSANPGEPRAAPVQPMSTDAPALGTLAWDRHVGWEPTPTYDAEGHHARPAGSYLRLRGLLEDPALFAALARRSAGLPLHDKPLIGRLEELCHPTLREVVAEVRPPRLLLFLEGAIDGSQVPCLESLATPKLFISACSRATGGCASGDSLLASLAESEQLRARVAGLGTTLGREASWGHLTHLTALSHLAIRGEALRHVDMAAAFAIVGGGALQTLDALDPTHLGRGGLHLVPARSVARLREVWLERAPLHEHVGTCSLERMVVWSIPGSERARWERSCPGVRLEEMVHRGRATSP